MAWNNDQKILVEKKQQIFWFVLCSSIIIQRVNAQLSLSLLPGPSPSLCSGSTVKCTRWAALSLFFLCLES